jgi:hypothetical protein
MVIKESFSLKRKKKKKHRWLSLHHTQNTIKRVGEIKYMKTTGNVFLWPGSGTILTLQGLGGDLLNCPFMMSSNSGLWFDIGKGYSPAPPTGSSSWFGSSGSETKFQN